MQAMRDAGIDVLVVCGTSWQEAYLRYVADFAILEETGIAMLSADGRCRMWLESAVEAERAEMEAADCEVHFARDLQKVVGVELDRLANQKAAVTPRHLMPTWIAAPDRRLRLDDAGPILDRLFMLKLPGELAAIRRACALADDGYAHFCEIARPGRRQYEIVADVEAFLRSKGSPDNFQIIGSGGVDVRGMTPPSDRRLAPGDLVTTELTPAIEGYFAQICRTLVLGKASARQKKAFGVYLDALEAGVAAVRAGVTAADVARAENAVFRKHGLGDYVTSKYTRVRGHGLGLMPDMKPAILEDVEVELEPGMTIIVHPNTYHPEVGYLVLGDVVIVTETGCEVLTRTPRVLFEV